MIVSGSSYGPIIPLLDYCRAGGPPKVYSETLVLCINVVLTDHRTLPGYV